MQSMNEALRDAATTVLEVTQREGDDGTGGWQTVCDLAGAAAVILEQASALQQIFVEAQEGDPDVTSTEAEELGEFAEQIARWVRG